VPWLRAGRTQRLRGAQPPTLRPARGLLMTRPTASTAPGIDTAAWNDALPRTTQPWGGQGEGRGGLSSAHVVLQRCTRRRGGARARADSRVEGCPRAYTAHTTST
jgi:hypothetical protein